MSDSSDSRGESEGFVEPRSGSKKDTIRTTSYDELETIEATLDSADVDFRVRREYVVEIGYEGRPTTRAPRYSSEDTIRHEVLSVLAGADTQLAAREISEHLDCGVDSVTTCCSTLYRDGFLDRVKRQTDTIGGDPYEYWLKDEHVEQYASDEQTNDANGLSELFADD